MDLNSLREQIDEIDSGLLPLFEKRMDVVRGVAQFKQENGLPIFHPERENAILDRMANRARPEYSASAKVLYTSMMELSKIQQRKQIGTIQPFCEQIRSALQNSGVGRPQHPRVACQGVEGAYSHIAADSLFPEAEITFHHAFEDVFRAVEQGDTEYGVLPVDNSNAGSVADVYALMKQYDFFIAYSVKVKVEHCLAVRPGVSLDEVTQVYSHEQALMQCKNWFDAHPGKAPVKFQNTAMAAKFVSETDEPAAAICSCKSAKLYGLEILQSGIQNTDENYTRFMCIAKNLRLEPDANMVSVALSIPNVPNSLYKLLTVFAAAGVDLTKIESKPIGTKNFDVIFYIDFLGNVRDENVFYLLNHLESEYEPFKFLGNYKETEA